MCQADRTTGTKMKRAKEIIQHLSKFATSHRLHVRMQVLLTIDPLHMLCHGLDVTGMDRPRNTAIRKGAGEILC